MATVTYTALNRIISGHSVNTQYTIEFPISVGDFAGEVFVDEYVSLNGTREVVQQAREDDDWNITATFIDQAKLPEWDEFFYSVAGGQAFTIDFYGTIAVPDVVRNAVMLSARQTPRRTAEQLFDLPYAVRIV